MSAAQRRMIVRLRFILFVMASMASLFAVEQLLAGGALGLLFVCRVSGATLCLIALVVFRQQRWVEAWARTLAVGTVMLSYVFVAVAGTATSTGEYTSTALLFVGASLVTATTLLWGIWPQCATVCVAAVSLAAVIAWTDQSLAVLTTDAAMVVEMAFVLSIVIAATTAEDPVRDALKPDDARYRRTQRLVTLVTLICGIAIIALLLVIWFDVLLHRYELPLTRWQHDVRWQLDDLHSHQGRLEQQEQDLDRRLDSIEEHRDQCPAGKS